MNPSLKKRLFVIPAVAVILALLLTASILASYYPLIISRYSLGCVKAKNNINIVIIADLHDSSFGKDNERLIEKVKQQKPDLILTVGDMISDYREDYSYLSSLYANLSDIAPTYCSLGNHEQSHPESEKIKEILSRHANLLDNEYTEITVNGTDIRIGGLIDYHPDNEDLNAFIREFADTDKFTLLMSHCPEYYIWGVDEVKIDLMVSGHTHGGQVILPFAGGVFAPEQGYFPYYDYGIFDEESTTLVITRGLGSSKQRVPRFNNPPEIVSLTISPEVSYEQ